MSGLVFNLTGGGGSDINPVARVSVTPRAGVTYDRGVSGLDAVAMNAMAQAISNNSDVTNATETIYFDRGAEHRRVTVGDQITIAMNGKDYAFNIIGFNHDELNMTTAYGVATATGKAGITFEQDCVFDTSYRMNASNSNYEGWLDTEMRLTTMPKLVGYLPSDWQSVLKEVKKSTGAGGSTIHNYNIVDTVDTGFLLSYNETVGAAEEGSGYNIKNEGTMYKWYALGGLLAKKTLSGSDVDHWTRSPYRSNTTSYVTLRDKEGVRDWNVAGEPHDLALAFCV